MQTRSARHVWKGWIAAAARWLHFYLSMFGFAVLLLFSVTGFTLNHAGWFFRSGEQRRELQGQMNIDWLGTDNQATSIKPPASETAAQADPAPSIAKLEMVEHLRKQHGVRGAVAQFQADEAECLVSFKGPGYTADFFIDRQTGKYEGSESHRGAVAVLNDLHKGRDTGLGWSILIDVSAILLTLVGATGLVLLFFIRRRRRRGLIVALGGTLAIVVVFWACVP